MNDVILDGLVDSKSVLSYRRSGFNSRGMTSLSNVSRVVKRGNAYAVNNPAANNSC